jgi:hypothetical protein
MSLVLKHPAFIHCLKGTAGNGIDVHVHFPKLRLRREEGWGGGFGIGENWGKGNGERTMQISTDFFVWSILIADKSFYSSTSFLT